ncbi:Mobile element protein [Clostridiaceae bacterium JG1575]|nr:Mobile element protein [Clostridiaceae bacterium JG1575]
MKGSGTSIMARDLHEIQGKSISEIARTQNMSRNTVKKYLKEDVKQDKRVGSKRKSKLDSFKDLIQNLMDKGIYNSVVIFNRLLEKGFDGKISIIKDYLKPLRPPTVKEGPATQRFESPPGSQAQMDWGICSYLDTRNRVRKVACFVMVLGYSRMRYIEFCRRCDSTSLLRCMVHAFEYFGGIPQQVLTDHMKTVVLRMENKQAIWQEGFERFASSLGFVPKLCRVRRPQTKGKVERLVHYVKDNFMPGKEFLDVIDLNQQAMRWLGQVNAQVHGTTGEIPLHLLEQEKLSPLPIDGRHEAYTWESRKVSRDAFLSFDGVKYGVNWIHSGRILQVKVLDGTIYIVDENGELIQEHPQFRSGRKYVYAKGQYDGLPTMQGYTKTPKYGRQIMFSNVDVRDLNEYARAAEG